MTKVKSAACHGIQAYTVTIEADVAFGLPQFSVVGLPDPSVKEAKERIRTAIKNSGFHFPRERITINLAPADVKKEGSAYDLPMALGILAASEAIPNEGLSDFVFLGELALDGSIRPVKGAIAMASALSALKENSQFVVPQENAREASLDQGVRVYPVSNLNEVVQFLRKEIEIKPASFNLLDQDIKEESFEGFDFSEVKGQAFAKRALEIAVAGNHNMLLIGTPGSGKTMMAQRIPSILPPLYWEEALEITKIYSVAGYYHGKSLVERRPFRSPHHTISPVALVGGGALPKPGEISLAHGGVLFLDEFPEFRRDVLEALRSPMDLGEVTVSRAKMQVTFPSRFLLVASMNPCPCGYLSDSRRACRCSLGQIQKYQSKVSGPILDRIDLHVEVAPLSFETLSGDDLQESSAAIRERIFHCRKIQAERFKDRPFRNNSLMRPRDLKRFASTDAEAKKLLERAMKELRFSARAYFKILKIARTIADLTSSVSITSVHIAEAIQYRSLDRNWNH